MGIEELTAEDVDHLQRADFEPPRPGPGAVFTEAPAELRDLMRVDGIGRLHKGATVRPDPQVSGIDGAAAAPPTRDLLVSLYQCKVPLAFEIGGESGRARIRFGTWLPAGGIPAVVPRNRRLLETALRTLYPVLDLSNCGPGSDDAAEPTTPSGPWARGGLALGVPTSKPPDENDGVRQVDRLLRALGQVRWSALVLAQPVGEALVRNLKLQVINQMRRAQTAAKLGGAPSPLADHYVDLLTAQLKSLGDAQGTGAWRTAVYLLGDEESYPQVASLWRGLFSGERSLPEPVRVWDREEVPALTQAWALPDPEPSADTTSSRYRHPFQHQSLLSSAQLAAYVHLPTVETNGFAITEVPDFDTVPPPVNTDSLLLGSVVERRRVTTVPYGIRASQLTRHAFVTGVTGSGKTNTVFHLLRLAARLDIPFLVLEPAKTEYRVLLRDEELGSRLQVFTLGNETVSPLRLNPFEVPEGVPVAVHLDLLRSVFQVSFGMWTPLPQVLEASLHEVYADRGWDITAGTNRRLAADDNRSLAFPTLTDLVRKVEELVPRLGYEERVTSDLRAALRTRLNSLRTGGKGRMLDAGRPLSMDELLARPTVLELEGMGDDDDKAFMMGLLLIRLAEHRRVQGDVEGLRHLLVVEEAHRLLAGASAGGRRGEEAESDVRGKAVETFTHMLSEIRAYGQGVVVVDQVPTKLASDVLKNTNLKVVHRIVAGDDRDLLGASMAMTPAQSLALATLPIGRAAVFTDGEDAPLLIQMPRSKGGSGAWPSHPEVREHMASHPAHRAQSELLSASVACDHRCLASAPACAGARAALLVPAVVRALRRVALSAVLNQNGLQRAWRDVEAIVEPSRPRDLDRQAFLGCLARHGAWHLADVRGARAGWTYAEVREVAELLDAALTGHLAGGPTSDEVARLRLVLLALQGGGPGPFQGCARIWADRPGPCLCAVPVAELVAEGGFAGVWGEAREADRTSPDGRPAATWDLCRDAAYQLVELPEEDAPPDLMEQLRGTADRTALCFAQQMLATEKWAHPGRDRRALTQLLALAERTEERGP
ncbi:ATP-binding protein [Streptomyces sp. NPDC058685]|uniref:ATP-binding protein n=1 Tax=Streptomyces sp. NPDC058685 TaxID=3346598 RepID=UPI00365A2786